MSRKYHIVAKDDGWNVVKHNGSRIGASHKTKDEAIRAGRNALRKAGGGQLVVHGRDGLIHDSDTVFGSGSG